jgi:hypothetical protein
LLARAESANAAGAPAAKIVAHKTIPAINRNIASDVDSKGSGEHPVTGLVQYS